ncbi:hypothetical protein BCR39DRAFT_587913 [Naematelia encephala]|uniref:Uncharacterized protein n=1 Tax=Naematelia encephala TaxID=71784 RepID=A0A1Y2B694_9TREE|nr:hypothetical protein BCR39DRAFT_587913 [Naematelia encephala]
MSKSWTRPSATAFRKLSRKRIRRLWRGITAYKSTFTGAASSKISHPTIPSVNYVPPGHRFPLLPMTTPQCSSTSGNPYPICPVTPTSSEGSTMPFPIPHSSTFPTYQPRPKFCLPGTKESIFPSNPSPIPFQLVGTSTITYRVPSYPSNDFDTPETTMLTVALRESNSPTRGFVEAFTNGKSSCRIYTVYSLTTTNDDISSPASQGTQRESACSSKSDGHSGDNQAQSVGDLEPTIFVYTPRSIRSASPVSSSADTRTATCVDSQDDEELSEAIELSRISWEDARTGLRNQLVSALQQLDTVSSTTNKEQGQWPLGNRGSYSSMDLVGGQQQDETRQRARDLISDYIWRGYATKTDASLLSDALDEVTR